MAMISSSLKTEVDALQKVMPGLAYDRLQAHEILNTRIAIGLHPSNRVRKASLEQIKKVLLAEIKNWSRSVAQTCRSASCGGRRRRRDDGDRIRAARRQAGQKDHTSST